MQIADFSIRNPVKVAVGVILATLFGLIALTRIPIQLVPEVTRPVVSVYTRWPGASPQEIEREIIYKQEEQLHQVAGVTDFRSESADGWGVVEMEFAVGTDMSTARLDVANRLDQIREYPDTAEEPVIETSSVNSSSIAYFSLMARPPSRNQLESLVAVHPELGPRVGDLDTLAADVIKVYSLAEQNPQLKELIKDDPNPTNLRQFAEDVLAAHIEHVSGVSEAEVYGGSEEQMRVIIDPVQLAAHQLTVVDLRRALVGENKDISAGDIWEGKRSVPIRTLGQYRDPRQIQDTIVAFRAGAPVYVKNVARVELGYSKPEGVGHQRGLPMLTIAVKRESGANVLDVMAGVKQAVAELNRGVLAVRGLQLLQTYDETVYIESALSLVRHDVLIGSLLTIGSLLLFLRSVRSTLVISLAIPISCIGTFVFIKLLGRSINVVSLAAITFAVGVVVDNATVVLENIYSHYQRGAKPFAAALSGTNEVWGAIVASTLASTAVFLPVVFIQEEAGQLFRDIAIAITVGVIISLFVSITVVPSAAARLLRQTGYSAPTAADDRDWFSRFGHGFVESVVRINARLQQGAIGGRLAALLIVLFTLGVVGFMPVASGAKEFADRVLPVASAKSITLAVAAILVFIPIALWYRRAAVVLTTIVFSLGISWRMMPGAEYLPEGNNNLIIANLQPPPGYNIRQLESLGRIVESRLRPYWEARPGTPEARKLDGPEIDTFFLVARRGGVFMGARVFDADRASELVPVLREATSDLPGVIAFVNQSSLFERRSSSGRSIDIEITGPEMSKLVAVGQHIMGRVKELYPEEKTETMVRPIPNLDLGSPEVHVVRNLEKAAERGVTTLDLGYTIDALVDGAFAGPYWHEGKEIDLVIYGEEGYAERTHDVALLPIGTPQRELVRVGDVANVELSTGPEMIVRVDRERTMTIQVRPGRSIPLEDAMNRIQTDVVEPLRESGVLGELYHVRLAGTADDLRRMRSAMSGSLLLALVITYLLIAALYESFLYPLVILMSVPMAAVGGLACLGVLNWFTLQPLDSLTMLGFVILIGTVVNNAILIVDQALVLIREHGRDHRTAVLESTRGRIRPIFITTLTTLVGLLPLVLMPGAGSELYRGLGTVVLGGLTISTIFTLFLVPLLFTLLFELQGRVIGERVAA